MQNNQNLSTNVTKIAPSPKCTTVIPRVTDENGNVYDNVVSANENIFKGYKRRDWKIPLKDFVKNVLTKKQITLSNSKGETVTITFAQPNERTTKDGGTRSRNVLNELAYKNDRNSQYAVANAVELVEVSFEDEIVPHSDEHSHQWLDENGWDYRFAYMQIPNGNIYKVTLNIANTRDGRKILYDINKISAVGRGTKHTDNNLRQPQLPTTLDDNVSQGENIVNNNSVQKSSDNSSVSEKDVEKYVADRKNNNTEIEQSSDVAENNATSAEAERYDIPEGSEIVNNIVVDEHSKRLKRENPRAYSNIVRMAKRLGMNVHFVKGLTDENGKVLEGLITSKGIFINADAKNPSRFVATHEFGHRMKQAAPEVWAAYQEYVINKLKRESFGNGRSAYDVLYEETKNAYGKDDTAYINEEIAVNYAGELFDSEEMLESFIREDKSLALRVRDWWYNVLESMGLLSEKKKAQQLWLRAYTAAAKNVKEGKVGEYNEKRASQMRNAEGKTRSEETDEQRRKKGFQKNSLIKKIQSNLEQLSKEDVILSLNTDIFNDRNMNIVEQVGNFFNSLGNEVYRAGFGEVILDKDGIKSAIGHKLGRAKCIAFRAVPDIIKYGKQIDYQEKWKGRPYDSYVFAGKVKIGKEDAFVGVVVTKNKNTSEYYLHEIVDNEGNFISIKNDEVVPNKTVSKTDNSLHGGTTSSVDTIISQDNPSVNNNSMQNTAENAQEGKKSIAGTRLSELVEKYGAIPSGEKPHRNVQVPRKTSQDKKVSQTVRTILEAKATPDEAVPTIEKMVEDGTFSYDVYTGKQAIADASA